MMMALKYQDERSIMCVAGSREARYRSPVAANSAARFGDLKTTRRNSAPIPIAGAFFVPAIPSYGGCAWETFVSAGFRVSRFANLRTAATHCLATMRGGSLNTHGALPMRALNPSKIRAAAHRAMAMAALRANSSLSVRLARYNRHMDRARSLEQGGAQ